MSENYSASEETDEPTESAGYRSYEVYQRERVGETTNLVNPRALMTDDYLSDPFAVPGIMREKYPCYRDWVGNRFWVTRYDDVTSVFTDDANFETRPSIASYAGDVAGVDLGGEPQVKQVLATRMETDSEAVTRAVLESLAARDSLCLVADIAGAIEKELWLRALGLGEADDAGGAAQVEIETLRAGVSWNDAKRIQGAQAFAELANRLDPLLDERRQTPTEDLLGVAASLDATGFDVAVTILELGPPVLAASLANLWSLLLRHLDQLAAVRAEPRLMKAAYLESLRHSPVVVTAARHTRHEVERFGRLLPQGALVQLSAAAANRDPRQFRDPDDFDIERKDLCLREPRGQYRADGLPTGITFAHGKPSLLPAVPKEGPRSPYAITRDIAVHTSLELLERFPALRASPSADLSLRLTDLDGHYTSGGFSVLLD